MLDTNLKQQLNTYLQYIVNPIEISVSGNDSDKSAELLALASEIAEMSPKIIQTSGTAARKPSMSVAPQGQAPRVHFAGIPMGHEFTSLVLALLQSGGHPSRPMRPCRSRSAISKVSSTSRPISPSPATTART